MNKIKIVSGGQTGVDRAALDAALQIGIECGGWCPEGRIAEDGVISLNYPVIELKNAGYEERTLQNILDSDASVIIYFDTLSGGTEKTLLFCINREKTYLLIDATELSIKCAAKKIQKFINAHSVLTLNIAGLRASTEACAYSYTLKVIKHFLKK